MRRLYKIYQLLIALPIIVAQTVITSFLMVVGALIHNDYLCFQPAVWWGKVIIGSLGMMVYLDWKLSILTLVVIPVVGQAMKVFGRKIKVTGTVIQERLADITSLLQESISSGCVFMSWLHKRSQQGISS